MTKLANKIINLERYLTKIQNLLKNVYALAEREDDETIRKVMFSYIILVGSANMELWGYLMDKLQQEIKTNKDQAEFNKLMKWVNNGKK